MIYTYNSQLATEHALTFAVCIYNDILTEKTGSS